MYLSAVAFSANVASGQISAFSLQLEGQQNVTVPPWLLLATSSRYVYESCLIKHA